MAQINVRILDQTGQVRAQVQMPDDVPIGRLKARLITRLGLSLFNPEGQPQMYNIAFQGRQLGDEETLEQAGVPDGAEIRLFPETTAGGSVEENTSHPSGKKPKVDEGYLDSTHTQERTTKAFAIARIQDHPDGHPFYLGEKYRLQTGILREAIAGFLSKPVDLPNAEVVEIGIAIFAQDMDISPHWFQTLYFFKDKDTGLLEFQLSPKLAGNKQIRIDFYYQQHWLQNIEFQVEVLAEKPITVLIKHPVTGITHRETITHTTTASQLIQSFLTRAQPLLLPPGESYGTWKLVFNGLHLSEHMQLDQVGVMDGNAMQLIFVPTEQDK